MGIGNTSVYLHDVFLGLANSRTPRHDCFNYINLGIDPLLHGASTLHSHYLAPPCTHATSLTSATSTSSTTATSSTAFLTTATRIALGYLNISTKRLSSARATHKFLLQSQHPHQDTTTAGVSACQILPLTFLQSQRGVNLSDSTFGFSPVSPFVVLLL